MTIRDGRDGLPEASIKRLMALAQTTIGPRSLTNGSQLALMHLRGEITRPQLDAALEALCAFKRYLRVIDARQVRGASLESGIRAAPVDPDSEAGDRQAERDRRDFERYARIRTVLIGCGRIARRDFEAVAFEDAAPHGWPMRANVVLVCEALRAYRERGRRNARRAKQ